MHFNKWDGMYLRSWTENVQCFCTIFCSNEEGFAEAQNWMCLQMSPKDEFLHVVLQPIPWKMQKWSSLIDITYFKTIKCLNNSCHLPFPVHHFCTNLRKGDATLIFTGKLILTESWISSLGEYWFFGISIDVSFVELSSNL